MKKDIFIDTNIAKNFTNPLDDEYKKLVQWLATYDKRIATKDENNAAFLVISHKLLVEYIGSSQHTASATNIAVLVDKLTRENRLNRFEKAEITAFQQAYFTKPFLKKYQKIKKDLDHIPIILLSDRQFALTNDTGLTAALQNISGFAPTIADRPEKLDYNSKT
jgi:hypothetical protein